MRRVFGLPISDGIPGVASLTFLRAAMNAHRKAQGQGESRSLNSCGGEGGAGELGISMDMLKRPLNTGFSGGEKKRNEVLQMAAAQAQPAHPRRDGLRPRHRRDPHCRRGRERLRSPERSILVITHYQRLLNYIVPDKVHVMARGQILRSGGKELALELEESGYAGYGAEAA